MLTRTSNGKKKTPTKKKTELTVFLLTKSISLILYLCLRQTMKFLCIYIDTFLRHIRYTFKAPL